MAATKIPSQFKALLWMALFLLTSCAYNPFIRTNPTTGKLGAGVLGMGIGAASMTLIDAPKPLIPIMSVSNGMLGYYLSTLRHASSGILQGGGQVYLLGQNLGIDLPTAWLFEPNTADFLPRAFTMLASTADVLKRLPHQNIIITGNTSGFFHQSWEQQLSQLRAKKIANYLADAGVNNEVENGNSGYEYAYVGYGSEFPIANNFTNKGIRANSRIQIISYPTQCELRNSECVFQK